MPALWLPTLNGLRSCFSQLAMRERERERERDRQTETETETETERNVGSDTPDIDRLWNRDTGERRTRLTVLVSSSPNNDVSWAHVYEEPIKLKAHSP